jgi:hypothetical protein
MKNLFIPYELAVIAKEKGFNELCFGCYITSPFDPAYLNDDKRGTNQYFKEGVTAPLYQQIVDWFEETHKIVISRDRHINNGFRYWVYTDKGIDVECYKMNKTEALNKAIEEAFKLI